MAELASYSPEDVTILLAGVVNVSGFVDGEFVTISKSVETFTTRESSDGVVSRTHIKSGTYDVSLILASTSDSNQALTYLARVDELTRMGKFPLLIKDQQGSTLLFSPTSWIEMPPDTSFSTSITEREWVIKCANAVLNVGGNYGESGSVEDIFNVGSGFLGGLL